MHKRSPELVAKGAIPIPVYELGHPGDVVINGDEGATGNWSLCICRILNVLTVSARTIKFDIVFAKKVT